MTTIAQMNADARTAIKNNDWETIDVVMPDKSITPLLVFSPEETPRGVVVLWPGLGMGARYFTPMARELVSRGYGVVLSELRGQGGQTSRATRSNQWGYHDLASQDYPRVTAAARAHFEEKYPVGEGEDRVPLYFMCHSMGGQIGMMYLSRPEADVDAAIFIGSGIPHYVNFTGKQRWRLRYGSLVMRALSTALGYWPDGRFDVAGYGRQSGRHIREWVRYSAVGRLKASHADQNYDREQLQITTPILVLTCGGDYDCPPESARDLAARLPKAARYGYVPERLGHNRWAREPKAVADRFEDFLDSVRAGQHKPSII